MMPVRPHRRIAYNRLITCANLSSMSIERLHGLSVFVRAAEASSFTAAAHTLGTTPSAVSKSVTRLEARLGVKLFQRSTRAVMLTVEGRAYYERIASQVRELEEAADAVTPCTTAVGRLRVSMPGDLARSLLGPITAVLMPKHPRLMLDVNVSDQHVDLIRQGFDLALRVGHAADSGLQARPIARLPLVLVAAPEYLARHGVPRTISDLAAHQHIRYRLSGQVLPIAFATDTCPPLEGVFDTDSGEAMRIAALNGLGIAQLLWTTVQRDLDAGTLHTVLPDVPLTPVPLQILHGLGRRLPARARVFLDFVTAEFSKRGAPTYPKAR